MRLRVNVFQIWVETSCIPLTVIAEGYEAAEMLYAEWRRAHDLGDQHDLQQVAQRNADWLADHPQLAKLAAAGRAGIAYWVDHRVEWVLAAPSDEPQGQLQPSESPVRYYLIELYSAGRVMVFATSPQHARDIYLAMHDRAFGTRPRRFTITTASRWLLTGEMAALREEMDAGRVGIAARTEEEGWHIFPPTDERVVP